MPPIAEFLADISQRPSRCCTWACRIVSWSSGSRLLSRCGLDATGGQTSVRKQLPGSGYSGGLLYCAPSNISNLEYCPRALATRFATHRHTAPGRIADVRISDSRKIAIDKVGIKAIRHPVKVLDKTGGAQHTIATFGMYVSAPIISRAPTCPADEILNGLSGDLRGVLRAHAAARWW